MKNLAYLMKTLKKSTFALFIATNAGAVQANNSAHLMVQETAKSYVASEIITSSSSEVIIDTKVIDPRIHIPPCPVEMEAKASPESLKQSNVTVKVFCPSNNWFHYLTVNVTETKEVVVVKDTLSPGSLLTADDVEVVKMDKKRLRGTTFADIDSVIGARIKRRARGGHPLSPRMMCFVCKGDAIVISANMTGLEIKTSGVAQQDGNIGETILVRNTKSKKIINARVTTVKKVEVQI